MYCLGALVLWSTCASIEINFRRRDEDVPVILQMPPGPPHAPIADLKASRLVWDESMDNETLVLSLNGHILTHEADSTPLTSGNTFVYHKQEPPAIITMYTRDQVHAFLRYAPDTLMDATKILISPESIRVSHPRKFVYGHVAEVLQQVSTFISVGPWSAHHGQLRDWFLDTIEVLRNKFILARELYRSSMLLEVIAKLDAMYKTPNPKVQELRDCIISMDRYCIVDVPSSAFRRREGFHYVCDFALHEWLTIVELARKDMQLLALASCANKACVADFLVRMDAAHAACVDSIIDYVQAMKMMHDLETSHNMHQRFEAARRDVQWRMNEFMQVYEPISALWHFINVDRSIDDAQNVSFVSTSRTMQETISDSLTCFELKRTYKIHICL